MIDHPYLLWLFLFILWPQAYAIYNCRHWCNFQMQKLLPPQRMLWMEEAYLGDSCIICLTWYLVQLWWTYWLWMWCISSDWSTIDCCNLYIHTLTLVYLLCSLYAVFEIVIMNHWMCKIRLAISFQLDQS